MANNYCTKLISYKYGKAVEVVEIETEPIFDPGLNEVLIHILLAPVNPVDINTIEGKYIGASLPTVPGHEGVGKVIKTGPGVKRLQVGDHVIPLRYRGTWKTHVVLEEDLLLHVPSNLGLVEASMLSINPPTVYRLLKDYIKLSPGDSIIQNGANSACGQMVIQMCRSWGIITVNVIRDRPDIDNLKSFLKSLGANYVFTETEIKHTDIFQTGKVARPMLALNCVGGQSASGIMKHLDFGGSFVTYGGMSKKPVTVPTSALIFQEISLEGFNINSWMSKNFDNGEIKKMYEEIFSMILRGDFRPPPYVLVKFKDFKDALTNTIHPQGMVGKKYIIDFRPLTSKI